MGETKRYVIAVGDTCSELEGKVNSYLEAGFELHGTLIMQPEFGWQFWYQPMIYSDKGEG